MVDERLDLKRCLVETLVMFYSLLPLLLSLGCCVSEIAASIDQYSAHSLVHRSSLVIGCLVSIFVRYRPNVF